jgi:hypothetical protein
MFEKSEERFRRSSFCSRNCCVEVANDEQERQIRLRNSANAAAIVVFSHQEWRAFLEGVKAGEFEV